MRLPTILSSTVLIATAILGFNNTAYAQCQGGYCPIPNAYFDQNAPSKYGYNAPNSQGNQNPNWQGNQSPDWRNDNGWRGGSNQSYYQGSNNTNYRNNTGNYNNNASWNNRTSSNSYNTPSNVYNQNVSDQGTYSSGNGHSYYYRNLSDTASDQTGSDKMLQQKVEDSLKNNYLKKNYSTVNARVYNGNVTLMGSVDSEQDRQDVENRIRSLKGVNNVNDQLQVGSSTQTSSNDSYSRNETAEADSYAADQTANVSDQDLQKQAEDTLKNNYVKKNYDAILISVSNGIITVTGIVDSDKDREEIRQRLQKLRGAKNVDDRTQVTGAKTSYNYKKPAYAR